MLKSFILFPLVTGLLHTQSTFRSRIYAIPQKSENELRGTLEELLNAVEAGRTAEEIESSLPGARVSQIPSRSPREQLFEKLEDAQVRARVTEAEDEEEMVMMMALGQELRRARSSTKSGDSYSLPSDPDVVSLIGQLQAEVKETASRVSLDDEIDRMDTAAPATTTTGAINSLVDAIVPGVIESASPSSPSNKDSFESLLRAAMSESQTAAGIFLSLVTDSQTDCLMLCVCRGSST